MRLYVDLDALVLVVGFRNPESLRGPTGENSFATKRGDTPTREIQFGRTSAGAEEIDATTPISSFKYGLKRISDFAGSYVVSNYNGSTFAYTKTGAQRFADAVTVAESATLTSATAAFSAQDIGLSILGAGIPADATIAGVSSATTATLSLPATASASGVVIVIGRTPTYTVAPNYNSPELADALVDGTIGETVSNAAARLALTGKLLKYIVKQADNGSYWIVVDPAQLSSAAGWALAPQKEYIDLAGEIEVKQGTQVTSTLTFTERVYNDVNKGAEGLSYAANPSYPAPADLALQSDLRYANRLNIGQVPRSVVPQLNLEAHCAQAVDERIAGKTKSAAVPIYTTQTHTGTPAYVRNASCWAADVDLTCVSPWNSDGGIQKGGTLITPDIIVFANHFPIINGATLRFVSKDGQIVERSLLGQVQIGTTDIQVGRLSTPVPSTITPALLLRGNAVISLANLPLAKSDAEEKLLVSDIASSDTDSFYLAAPTDSQRLAFHEAWVGGDSGSPAFLVIDGKLVVLGCATSSGSGRLLHKSIAAIESAIASLGSSSNLSFINLPIAQKFICSQIVDLPVLSTLSLAGAIPLMGNDGKLNVNMLPANSLTVDWANVINRPFTFAAKADGSINSTGNAVLYNTGGSIYLRADSSFGDIFRVKGIGTNVPAKIVGNYEKGLLVGSYGGTIAAFGSASGSYSDDSVFPTINTEFSVLAGGALSWSGSTSAAAKATTRANLGIVYPPATQTDGSTITINVSGKMESFAQVTLAGNRTLAISGLDAGARGTLLVKQDATGGRTLTLPSGSKVVDGGSGAITLSSAANATDILSWVYDGTNLFWFYGRNFT